ncbi:MAG: hypothetical protein WCW02_01450 [Candidatus Buchananbacteria bacterium]
MWSKIKALKLNLRQSIILVVTLLILGLLGGWGWYDQNFLADNLARYLPENPVYYVHLNLTVKPIDELSKSFLNSQSSILKEIWPEPDYLLSPEFLTLVDREVALAGFWQTTEQTKTWQTVVIVKTKQAGGLVDLALSKGLAIKKLANNIYLLGQLKPELKKAVWSKTDLYQLYQRNCLKRANFCAYLSANQIEWPSNLSELLKNASLLNNLAVDQPSFFSWHKEAKRIVWQIVPVVKLKQSFAPVLWRLAQNLPKNALAVGYNLPVDQWVSQELNLVGLSSELNQEIINTLSGSSLWWQFLVKDKPVNLLVLAVPELSQDQVSNFLTSYLARLWPKTETRILPDRSSYQELIVDQTTISLQSQKIARQVVYNTWLPSQKALVWWQKDGLLFLADSLEAANQYLLVDQERVGWNYAKFLAGLGNNLPAWSVYLTGDWLEKLNLKGFKTMLIKQENAKLTGFLQ